MKVDILMAILLITPMIFLSPDAFASSEKEIILSVPGIPGPYCAYGLEKRLLELEGVERVDLLWRIDQIRIVVIKDNKVTPDEIREAVRRADYPYQYTIMP
ncbi:MAG: heavy-metal-associated domain-containing protein [Chloroflexi bacterium]|nr:heavy-metal-associated domain-containing protein [Chloroflexota bacterium]